MKRKIVVLPLHMGLSFALLSALKGCDGFQSPLAGAHRGTQIHRIYMAPSSENDVTEGSNRDNSIHYRPKMRDKVKKFAKSIIVRPMTAVAPQAIAEILADATTGAVEVAKDSVEELKKGGRIRTSQAFSHILETEAEMEGSTAEALDSIALTKTAAADAFLNAEMVIKEAEEALMKSKLALQACRQDVAKAIAKAETAVIQANIASQKSTALAAATAAVSTSSMKEIVKERTEEEKLKTITGRDYDGEDINGGEEEDEEDEEEEVDITSLSYEDVDYHLSEMAPPFINEDQCLVPGEAVVRVEKAAENSRRIFAGIDIMASVDDVWDLLTDYENLQKVVPNLVMNEVQEYYDAGPNAQDYEIHPDVNREDEISAIQGISKTLKGAKLKQIGGAKVVGINFSAQVTLEVREWPKGIPFVDETNGYDGKAERRRKLERYRFPRPFAISKLPTKDISMQSVENDDGEFRMYQGVWRMQPLPGCAPEGGAAMRLTYAVEVSPRPYLPVAFVEGRISQDLCNNLLAIRDHVSSSMPTKN